MFLWIQFISLKTDKESHLSHLSPMDYFSRETANEVMFFLYNWIPSNKCREKMIKIEKSPFCN